MAIEYRLIELTGCRTPQFQGEGVGQRGQPVFGGRVVAVAGVALTPLAELTMMIDPPFPASIIAGMTARRGAPPVRG